MQIASAWVQARKAVPFAIRCGITGAGWFGAALIGYGSVAAITGKGWAPLDDIALPLSSALTILGTLLTAQVPSISTGQILHRPNR